MKQHSWTATEVMSRQAFDIAIVGAGVIGLALAREVLLRAPETRVIVLEKESHEAFHASGRNSGVLHAGFYYPPSSLKARFCVAGNREARAYCHAHNLQVNECGKLVVAQDAHQVTQLDELCARGLQNGAEVRLLSETEAAEIDPNARTFRQALYSPRTATIDPKSFCGALLEEIRQSGATISFNARFLDFKESRITTSRDSFTCGTLINCAGLYADSIAHRLGVGERYRVIPFKGLYLKYSGNQDEIATNIYPVPDLRLPFLGVHFTKNVNGLIKIGPTAIPAFWRESYSGLSRFDLSELCSILWQEAQLFLTNRSQFRNLAIEEMRKYWKPYLVGLASKLVHKIDVDKFHDYSAPGIRAQLLDRESGTLVQDFLVESTANSIHVLNAVSPGLTCCLPFARHICDNFRVV